jgi:hypothetical protein
MDFFTGSCDERGFERKEIFIEVDYFLERKHGEFSDGDVFLSRKNKSGSRIVSVLSDGLGSGIKANVLAALTASMLSGFVLKDISLHYASSLIINSLPVCKKRALSYAAFTLVDARHNLTVRFVEYENPPLAVVRDGRILELKKEAVAIDRKNKKTGPENEALYYSTHQAQPGDRIVFFSDGAAQAGIGRGEFEGGWGVENINERILGQIRSHPLISSRDLAKSVVQEAVRIDGGKAHDDISCGVVYYRKPRDALVVTGAPFHKENDANAAAVFNNFSGKKIILGGTTAKIIARELNRSLETRCEDGGPAVSVMEGADLVCEGALTLKAAAGILEEGEAAWRGSARKSAGGAVLQFIEYLLNSDRIDFIVGTKINEAHFNPDMPVELEARRAVIKRLSALLEERYFKQTRVTYI